MTKFIVTAKSDAEMQEVRRSIATAAGLMKELMGVANNAAWIVCLEARDHLSKLPSWNRRVTGGHAVSKVFKRVMDAFHAYERRLIYDEETRFFDLRDMPERTRRFYGDITNREYYDFWAATGGSTYERTRPLITSLWNKYRLALLHGGIEWADDAAWGLCAMSCLNSAVTIYRQSITMIHNEFNLPVRGLEDGFRNFSLYPIARMWDKALAAAIPECVKLEISDTDGKNIEAGIRQVMEAWTEGNAIYDDMEKTLRDCGEDVMRTKGFIEKSINDVQQLRKWHNECE